MNDSDQSNIEDQSIGKYRVLRTIGSGSMATVYLGQDPFIDRPVAIKVAQDEYVHSDENGALYRRLFFNEAQAAGMLKHPNITAIFDAGVDRERYYIVMEYVNGGQTLEKYTSAENLLPIVTVTDIIYQCAMALDYAHKKGVIHRDIKPRNILLTDQYEAKITDFGVAVVPELQQDQTPEHAGSPLYTSPEQVRHEHASNQCDLFSLGVVAYELLTGKHPFDGRNIEAINHRILESRPTPLKELRSDIPDICQRIVDKALAKDPTYRYKTGLDMAGDISLVYDFLRRGEMQPSQQEKFVRAQDLAFFEPFQDAEIWEVINAAEWLQIRTGEEIVRAGEKDLSFYILVDGQVAVIKNETEIIKLSTGDCFGEMGMIAKRERTADIVARTDVTVMKVRASVIERTTVNCQLRFQHQCLIALIERLEYATEYISARTPQD
jgi:serine/threonine protein kinase